MFKITGINVARGNSDVILYTPQFGLRTPGQSDGLEVVVKLSRPLLIIPISANAVVGTVSQIYDSSGSTLIPFDSVVVSVGADQRDVFLDNLSVGDSLRFNQEITGLSKDCKTGVSFPWTKAYASIGAALHLVDDSAIYPPIEDATRAPRTAIAYDDTYIYLIVVDGRQPDFSVGMTFKELGDFIVNTLHATNAVAQDGGGSSTMVVQGSVVNRPSDGCYMVFLPLVASPGGKVITAPSIPLDERFEPTDRLQHGCERRVANAMMIAQVAPKETSGTTFADGDVFTTMAAPLRVGPGTNYPGIIVVPAGSYGKIQSNEPILNGVRAKGTYWWKVAFD
ncbi:phosphodiester glycosidase family protein, partial [bacterium]